MCIRDSWGTGHAVLTARELVNDPFAVVNADDFYGIEAFQKMCQCLSDRVKADHFAMVGYELRKTLSSFGGVSRAVCALDGRRHLASVLERTEIFAIDGRIADRSQDPPVSLLGNELVSMNFWGFHPAFFVQLEDRFGRFGKNNQSDPQAEFYIPAVVDELIRTGSATVEVLRSLEHSYGLTYAEDKPMVQNALLKLTNDGLYPTPLWKR